MMEKGKRTEGHSCIVVNGDKTYIGDKPGIADLFILLKNNPCMLDGADVIDKVIGKGAAALLILGKVKSVSTPLISLPALKMIEENGITVEYDEIVPVILNRAKNDCCPLEHRCINTDKPEELLPIIAAFRDEMTQKMNNNK